MLNITRCYINIISPCLLLMKQVLSKISTSNFSVGTYVGMVIGVQYQVSIHTYVDSSLITTQRQRQDVGSQSPNIFKNLQLPRINIVQRTQFYLNYLPLLIQIFQNISSILNCPPVSTHLSATISQLIRNTKLPDNIDKFQFKLLKNILRQRVMRPSRLKLVRKNHH